MIRSSAAPFGRQAQEAVAGRYRILTLLTLSVIICNIDRMVIAILFAPISKEFALEDWQLGLLTGLGFTAFYAGGSLLFARLAERRDRIAIISILVTAWSVMTILCGMAGSYIQLLCARMGVGAAESGCQPVSHSLIGDLFPTDERPTATGVYAAGTLAGGLLALPLGGWIADQYGWRVALFAVGTPGFIIAALLRTFGREPRGRVGKPAAREQGDTLAVAVRAIFANVALRNAIFGGILFTLASAASLSFGPLYLIRVFHLTTGQAGLAYGLCSGVTAVIANLAIGVVTSRLTKRDRSWPAMIAAIGGFVEAPATVLFLLAPTVPLALAGLVLKSITGVLWFGPIIATVQMIAPPERRATAAACLVASYTLIGFGLGPVLAGLVGDLLQSRFGPGSIGYGLMVLQPFSIWAGFHFLRTMRAIRDDAATDHR